MERRIRRGELTRPEVETHLSALPDVTDLSTPSVPVEEPDSRVRERRPMVKVSPPPSLGRLAGEPRSRLDDLDDELDDDDDLDDEDEDEDEDLDEEDEK